MPRIARGDFPTVGTFADELVIYIIRPLVYHWRMTSVLVIKDFSADISTKFQIKISV